VRDWAESNREPLRLFWAKCPGDALAHKKEIEAKSAGAAGNTGVRGSKGKTSLEEDPVASRADSLRAAGSTSPVAPAET
jgi:hypothetical protein